MIQGVKYIFMQVYSHHKEQRVSWDFLTAGGLPDRGGT